MDTDSLSPDPADKVRAEIAERLRRLETYCGESRKGQLCPPLEFGRASPLCQALSARYPGIKFNQVEAYVRHDYWLTLNPDDDMVGVFFNLSADQTALEEHGFHSPGYVSHRVRTKFGWRFTGARYEDGLDRIAELLMPELLSRFQGPTRRP